MGSIETSEYEFTNLDQLQKILKDNWWGNDQLNRLFSSTWVGTPFSKITLTKENITELAKKLDSANTRFEQQNLLRQITKWNLIKDIWETFSFSNIAELEDAIRQKDIPFPSDYLSQVESFKTWFRWPRTLTKNEYDSLINNLRRIIENTPTANADRWNLIRSAFKDIPSPVGTYTETKEVNAVTLIALKRSLENEIAAPITIESLQKLLTKLSEEKDIDSKKIITSYLWSKLSSAWYIMTLQWGKISLQNTTDQRNAEVLEATISAYISAGKVNISELQRAILVWSGSFGTYLSTQKINIQNITTDWYADFLSSSLNINLKTWNPASKIVLINKSSVTPDEKAFLISYVNGGFSGYNLAPDAERQMKIQEAGKDLVSSPQYASTVARVDTISGGSIKAEQERMQAGWKWEELTLEKFMDNPIRAITKYPWVSLTLVIGWIWKFGFMKTIGGLLLGMIGIKAINELGDTEVGKEAKWALLKTGKEAIDAAKGWVAGVLPASAAPAVQAQAPAAQPAATPASTIDMSKLTPSQKKAYDRMYAEKSFIAEIDSFAEKKIKAKQIETGKWQDYINFIMSEEFQKITTEKSIYTTNGTLSIFSPTETLDPSLKVPTSLNNSLLKKMILLYLTGSTKRELVSAKQIWDKEKEEFEKKYPPATWKTKTLAELTSEIYK